MEIRRATAGDAPVLVALERACFAEPWSLESVAGDLASPLDEFTVARIASLPSFRRRGIARALLGRAIATARASGVTVVFLEVRAGNVPAIALYESVGFIATRRRKGYYADGEDALDMRWELT